MLSRFPKIQALSASPAINQVIGVIDLRDGQSVHARAGERQAYQPIWLPAFGPHLATTGNPKALVNWYRAIGIHQFYLADLDALTGSSRQIDSIGGLLRESRSRETWLLDLGLQCGEIDRHWSQIASLTRLVAGNQTLRFVIASESAIDASVIAQATQTLGSSRCVLGIDFQQGQLLGPHGTDAKGQQMPGGLHRWMRYASERQIDTILALELSGIGTQQIDKNRGLLKLIGEHPQWRWISGGGCRDLRDIQTFLHAGCEGCLVATALLPEPPSETNQRTST